MDLNELNSQLKRFFKQSFDIPDDPRKVAGMSATASESKIATKQRLIEAAEQLFADGGFEKVSVRDITQKAGANVAAVNYHFGSREGLVEIVMSRYISPVNEERLARLEALERKSGGKALPVEEIVEAFVRPFTTQVRKSELSEKLFFKLMGRMFGDQCVLPPAVEASCYQVTQRFHKAFSKTLPQVPVDEIWWRIHLMSGAMVYTMAHGDTLMRLSAGASGNPTIEQILSKFIRYASAGMRQDAGAGGEGSGPAPGPQVEFLF